MMEAGIGDSPYAHLAVVVGNLLEQEVDGVMGIGGVVHILGRFLVVDVRMHLDKVALAHPAAAHVLIDKDVTALFELLRRAEVFWILIFAVGADVIGSAVHEERVWASGVLGDIDGREEALAVAHGNTELVLGVVGADVVFFGRVWRRLLRVKQSGCKGKKSQYGKGNVF
jgi:hypothetical protein